MDIFKILAMAFTLGVCFALPLVLLGKAKRAFQIPAFKWGLLGAVGFVVPQLLIRIPLLQLPVIQAFLRAQSLPMRALLLAGTAALFETAGRFFALKILGNKLSVSGAYATGIGHGGIEAAVLVGIQTLFNLVFYVLYPLSPAQAAALPGLDSVKAMTVAQALNNTAAPLFFAAGLERLSAIAFHICMSTLLGLFILRKETLKGILLVVFFHTMLDFLTVMMGGNILVLEAVLLLFGIGCIYLTLKMLAAYGNKNPAPLPRS